MREDGRDLEAAHQAQTGDGGGLAAGYVLALEADGAAGGDEEVGEEIEAGGLAGAVGTDQRMDRTLLHAQRHIVHGDEAAELLGQPCRLQDGVAHPRPSPR